mmetsp:Transcript_13055/g.25757  ORF Transcript_13055/g.25757 Transcript_13055/m.25757 type:complete len:223 (+) Transcript_13055:153-821(+)
MAALEKASTAPAARAIILELDSSKLKIEEEMQVLIDYLEDSTNGSPAGVASPLCDAEGYPRPDIDIFATRQKRHRLNCLRNDRKEVMRQIEEALHELHAVSGAKNEMRRPEASTISIGVTAITDAVNFMNLQSFAIIEDVLSGSPASVGGLCSGDMVLSFGDVNHTNHRNLQALASVVSDSIGREITVVVRRPDLSGGALSLQIVPARWSGRGVLGCLFSPL